MHQQLINTEMTEHVSQTVLFVIFVGDFGQLTFQRDCLDYLKLRFMRYLLSVSPVCGSRRTRTVAKQCPAVDERGNVQKKPT